jgi:hypothetical protein
VIKTTLGDQVRDCLAGGEIQLPQTELGLGTWAKLRRKVKSWQSLARKYKRTGLSAPEVAAFLDELQGNRTKADLILELTVRNQDLKDASSEVRRFIDHLFEELAFKAPTVKTPRFNLEQKLLSANSKAVLTTDKRPLPVRIEEALTKSKKKPGRERLTKQVSEHLAMVLKLAQARDDLSSEEVAALALQPEQIFAYWQKYLQTEIKHYQTRRKNFLHTLKIRILGTG